MYGSWSWILSILAKSWFSLENRIFLTVSNSCLILQQIFQAGIKPSGIFGAALGGSPLFTSMADKGSGRQLKGAPGSLSLDHMLSIYRRFGSQRSKEKDSFYFKVIAYLQPEKLNLFYQDRFLALGGVVIREWDSGNSCFEGGGVSSRASKWQNS